MRKVFLFLIFFLFIYCTPRRTTLGQEDARLKLRESVYILNSINNIEGKGVIDFENRKFHLRSKFTFDIRADSLRLWIKHPLYGTEKQINLLKIRKLLNEIPKKIIINASYKSRTKKFVLQGFLEGKPVEILIEDGHLSNFSYQDTIITLANYSKLGDIICPMHVYGKIEDIKFEIKFTEIRRFKDD